MPRDRRGRRRVGDATGRHILISLMALLSALLGVAVAVGVVGAAPATAHAELVSISPKKGATLTNSPAAVVLRFAEEVNPDFATVALTRDGDAVEADPVAVQGAVVRLPIVGTLGNGRYTVAFRVVSADGHPVTGTSSFRVRLDAGTPSASESPTQSTVTPPAATADPTLITPVEPAQPTPTYKTPQTQPTTIGHPDHRPGIFIAVGLVLGGAALLLYERRRRRARTVDNGPAAGL